MDILSSRRPEGKDFFRNRLYLIGGMHMIRMVFRIKMGKNRGNMIRFKDIDEIKVLVEFS